MAMILLILLLSFGRPNLPPVVTGVRSEGTVVVWEGEGVTSWPISWGDGKVVYMQMRKSSKTAGVESQTFTTYTGNEFIDSNSPLFNRLKVNMDGIPEPPR